MHPYTNKLIVAGSTMEACVTIYHYNSRFVLILLILLDLINLGLFRILNNFIQFHLFI